MIFVTGPMFSGKKDYICRLLHLSEEDFKARCINNAEALAADAEDLVLLADELAGKEVVIASEQGAGVVPVEKEARRRREAAGRLSILLAERADLVIRVICGLPQVLKGDPESLPRIQEKAYED